VQSKITLFFIRSAVAVFFAVAVALLITSFAGTDILLPRGPAFKIPVQYEFWIISGICFIAGFFGIYCKTAKLRSRVILILASILGIYRFYCFCLGVHSLSGYLGNFSFFFGLSPMATRIVSDSLLAYLLFTSCFVAFICFFRPDWKFSLQETLHPVCADCGSGVGFSVMHFGQKRICNQCRTAVQSNASKPALKINCSNPTCGQHIMVDQSRFGTRIQCPACGTSVEVPTLHLQVQPSKAR
jgi:hypothetical protein